MVRRKKEVGVQETRTRRPHIYALVALLFSCPVLLWLVADWQGAVHLNEAKEALFENPFLEEGKIQRDSPLCRASLSEETLLEAKEWIQSHEQELFEATTAPLPRSGLWRGPSRVQHGEILGFWQDLRDRLGPVPFPQMRLLPRKELLVPLLLDTGLALAEEGRYEEALEAFAYMGQVETFRSSQDLWWFLAMDDLVAAIQQTLARCPETPVQSSLPDILAALRERNGTAQLAPMLIEKASTGKGALELPLSRRFRRLTEGDSLLWRPLRKEQKARKLAELSGVMDLLQRPAHRVLPRLLASYAGPKGDLPFRDETNVLVVSWLNEAVTDASLLCAQAGLCMLSASPCKDVASLEETAQRVVGALPPDPFSGSSLRVGLDHAFLRFYSLGKDLEDDGGVMKERGTPDIVFSLPLENLLVGVR